MAGTVRFSRIVETCGEPHVHTLWVAPDKDPELQRACAAHRVMTLQRSRGKTAHAVVGFEKPPRRTDQYLIFPKSLRKFEGARVVGVKFELIAQPKLTSVDAQAWKSAPTGAKSSAFSDISTRNIKSDTPEPAEPWKKSGKPASHATRAPRRAPPTRSKRAAKPAPPDRRRSSDTSLAEAVRAALTELEAGKTVAAYQRLERALAHASP